MPEENRNKITKSKNTPYFPIGEDIAIGYCKKRDEKFIVDIEEAERVFNHTWSAKIENGMIRIVSDIDGKHTYLGRFIMNTPDGMECDHINGNPRDNRKCNLRNCTKQQNLANRRISAGRVIENANGYIVEHPREESRESLYASKEEAYNELYRLDKEAYGNYSYWESKEFGEKNNSYVFSTDKIHTIGGVLEEIDNLPENNIYKIIFESYKRKSLKGLFPTDESATMWILNLIDAYKNRDK